MPRDYVAELLELMKRYSFTRGDFTLSSGKKSSFYYDGKTITQDPRGSFLIGHIVFGLVHAVGAEAVGGLAIGSNAISLAVAYTSELIGHPIPTFYVREQPKTHGTKQLIYASRSMDERPVISRGRRVAIVDDVMTTGASIDRAIKEVEREGCEVVLVVTLVDRSDPEADFIRRNYNFVPLFSADADGRVHVSRLVPASAAV